MEHPNLIRGLELLKRVDTPADLFYIWNKFDNSHFNWVEKSLEPWWKI